MKKMIRQLLFLTTLLHSNLQAFSMTSGGKVIFPGHPYVRTQGLENYSQNSTCLTNKTFSTVYIATDGNKKLIAIPAKNSISLQIPGSYYIYPHNRSYGNAICLQYNKDSQAQVYYCKVKNEKTILNTDHAEYIVFGNVSIYTDSTQPNIFLTIQ